MFRHTTTLLLIMPFRVYSGKSKIDFPFVERGGCSVYTEDISSFCESTGKIRKQTVFINILDKVQISLL